MPLLKLKGVFSYLINFELFEGIAQSLLARFKISVEILVPGHFPGFWASERSKLKLVYIQLVGHVLYFRVQCVIVGNLAGVKQAAGMGHRGGFQAWHLVGVMQWH
jgi:hypothetical protein